MEHHKRKGFWPEAIALHGSVAIHVLPRVLAFGILATAMCVVAWYVREQFDVRLTLETTPFEFAGVTMGLLLVIRTNAGYDRWWEARKLWGGIVNQSRNLAINAIAYGPADSKWRERFVTWAAVFPHVARFTLRGQSLSAEVANLLGAESANRLASADHMPSFVAIMLGRLLQEACEQLGMNRFAFLQIDRERMLLLDHIGGCERILTTPLPKIYSIKIRHFILLFLLFVPLSLLNRLDAYWHIPIITMLVAYLLLSLDQIGVELENPFSPNNLSHLHLDQFTTGIEKNLFGMLQIQQQSAPQCSNENASN